MGKHNLARGGINSENAAADISSQPAADLVRGGDAGQ